MSDKGDGGGVKSQKIGDVIFGQLHIIMHYVVDYPMGLRLVKNHSGPFATPIKHTPFISEALFRNKWFTPDKII